MKIQNLSVSILIFLFILTALFMPLSSSGADTQEINYIRVKTKSATLNVEEGESKITFETGATKTLKQGESETGIPDGSIISVVSGKGTLNADKTVILLKVNDNVLIFIDETYRTTSVQVPNEYENELVISHNGETQNLTAGETYWAPTSATAKTETKTESRKEVKQEGKEETGKVTSPTDTSSIIDEDTVREEREGKKEQPPVTPVRRKRKPGSDSGQ